MNVAFQRKQKQLEEAVAKADMIYIDTCSLMEPHATAFMKNLYELTQRQSKKTVIYVIQKVLDELNNNARNPMKSADEQRRAKVAIELVYQYEKAKKVERYGDPSEPFFADAVFKREFVGRRLNNTILYITEDMKNMKAIVELNSDVQQAAQRGKKIIFFSIRKGIVKDNELTNVKHNANVSNYMPYYTPAPGANPAVRPAPKSPANKPNYAVKPKVTTKTKCPSGAQGLPKSAFTNNDGQRQLHVELLRGDGYILSGMKKVKKLNFAIEVYYKGAEKDKGLKSLEAQIKRKDGGYFVRKLKEGKTVLEENVAEIQLPLEVTVVAQVKIGALRTIPIKVTVAKQF